MTVLFRLGEKKLLGLIRSWRATKN